MSVILSRLGVDLVVQANQSNQTVKPSCMNGAIEFGL